MDNVYKIRLVWVAVLLSISICMGAQPRSQSEALSIAQGFFAQGTFAQKSRMRQSPRFVAVQGREVARLSRSMSGVAAEGEEDASFYVFNDEANRGYVIVAGDERQTDVIGYSEEGLLDADNIPCGLRSLLEQYAREYELLQTHGDDFEKPAKAPTTSIGPLLTVTWSQSPYYNDQCPMDPTTNKRCVTGCQATAMAQIMKCHNYPSVGQGSVSYTSKKRSIKQSVNFASTPFSWSQMLAKYDKNSSSAAVNAVATLMHACGVSMYMDYGSDASSANHQNSLYAFIHYFKYNNNARFYSRQHHTSDEWDQYILQDLAAGRPILYRGESDPDADGNVGGHAFVLDGCDSNGRYHFNFGWNGAGNGHFYLSSIRPKASSEHNYTNKQAMLCRIDPRTVGTHEDPWYADKFSFNTSTNEMALTNVWCKCGDASTEVAGFNGFIGWELKNYSTGKSVYGLYSTGDKKANWGYSDFHRTIDASNFQEGATYLLYPVIYNNDKTQKTYIRTLGCSTDYIMLQVKNGKITASVKGDPDGSAKPKVGIVGISADNPNLAALTQNDILQVHGTFKNTGKTYNVNTRLRIWTADKTKGYTGSTVTKSIPKDAEVNVDFEYPLHDIPPGDYIITVQYQVTWADKEEDNGWYYNEQMAKNITVKEAPVASTPILQFVSTSADNQALDNLTTDDKLVIRATLKNTGKTYNVNTRLRIWDEEMEPIAVSSSQAYQMTKDGQTTVKFEYPLSKLSEGKYIATIQYQATWDDNKWYYNKKMLTNFVVKELQNPEMQFVNVTCDNQNLSSLTVNDKLKFHATLQNNGKAGNVRVCLMIWNDKKKYVSDIVTKYFPKDAQTSLSFEYPLTKVESGTYTAAVIYEAAWIDNPSNWYYNSGLSKQITVQGPSEPEVTWVSVTCGNQNPLNLTQDDMLKLNAVFKNTGKTADVQTRVRFFPPEMTGGYQANTRTTTFPQGSQTTVINEVLLKDVAPGTYYVTVQYLSSWTNNKWKYHDKYLIEIHVSASTPVDAILADEKKKEPVYDLHGRRVENPGKGIYVVSGKKKVIK